ncbi:MAG: hypothetical protein JRD68_16325 [Deltaproteobacteria bacterium]|nr:hypothetical protein [Deltaproteobacteria bacterium]
MNRIIFKYSCILLVLTACVFFLNSCTSAGFTLPGKSTLNSRHPGKVSQKKGPPPWAPAHGYRAKHKYRYYHDAQVYFDVGRRMYFYYRGGQWHVSVTLPAGISISMNRYITLEMDSEKPYKYHKDVKKKYSPGQRKKALKGKKKKK